MNQLTIGALVNTHGLKGEVKVKILTQFPDVRFKKGNIIYVHFEHEYIPVKIAQIRNQKDFLLLSFEGYADINLVEKWKGSELCIDRMDAHELEEDEAYFFELQDSEVVSVDGTSLGVVSEVIETGANAVLRVTGEQELLIPYVKAFIVSFERGEKRITVKLMDGML